jgi:pyruvate formate lyase activating enzyme
MKLGRNWVTTAQAVEGIAATHSDPGFLGVGTPYNRELVDLDEVEAFGRRLARIDPEVQLCVLYHFPTYRQKTQRRPRPQRRST